MKCWTGLLLLVLLHQRIMEHQEAQLPPLRDGKDPITRTSDKLCARFHRMAAVIGSDQGPRRHLQESFRVEVLAMDVGNSVTGKENVRPVIPRITCIAMIGKYGIWQWKPICVASMILKLPVR